MEKDNAVRNQKVFISLQGYTKLQEHYFYLCKLLRETTYRETFLTDVLKSNGGYNANNL